MPLLTRVKMSLLTRVRLCRSPSAEAVQLAAVQPEAVQPAAVQQFEAVQFGVVPSIVEEPSFEEEQLRLVAVVMSLGDTVIRAINIVVAAPTLPVFIVAVRSQLAARS